MVMLILLTLSIFGIGLMKLAESDAVESSHFLNRTRAFWLAEAGIQEFVGIAAETENRTQLDYINLVGDDVIVRTIPDCGSYSVDIVDETALLGVVKRYRITSTGRALDGTELSVSVLASTETFSVYTYASHSEGDAIWFTDKDVIGEEGKNSGILHSNGRLKVSGSPDFWAEVRSADSVYTYKDSALNGTEITDVKPDVFHGGLTLGAPQLDFGERNFDSIKAAAPAELNGDYSVEFDDEVYYLTDSAGVTTTNNIANLSTGNVNERIIYVKGDVSVKGNVGTAVSVAAEGSIYITDDIVYTSSLGKGHYTTWPSAYVPDSDEVLGLFSETRVQIAEGWMINTDQPADTRGIDIHATILVTKSEGFDEGDVTQGGFGVDWEGTGSTYGYVSKNGKIYLYGSLSQYRRVAVGFVDGRGYIKRYGYDPRLADKPPPGTPYSSFSLTEWNQL